MLIGTGPENNSREHHAEEIFRRIKPREAYYTLLSDGISLRLAPLILAIVFLLSFFPSVVGSQTQQYRDGWRLVRFTTESGLPSNEVSNVIEARDGTTWAATAGGLVWYDGFHWRRPHDTSNYPRKSPAWVVGVSGGTLLAVFDGKIYQADTNGLVRFHPELDGKLPRLSAVVAVEDSGYLLLSIVHSYLLRGGVLSQLPDPGSFEVAGPRFFLTKAGSVWVNTRGGILRWNGARWVPKMEAGGAPFEIFHLLQDSGGLGMVSIAHPMHSRGIWTWRGSEPPVHDTAEGRDFLQAMDLSPSGEILAVYRSGDVRSFRNGRWSTIVDALPELKRASFLKFSSSCDLWVGTGSGLLYYKCSSNRWTHWSHPFPNSDNTVNEILLSRDSSIWLGTEGGVEVHMRDGTVRSFHEIDGTRLFVVTGLNQDAEGGIWISSGSGFDGAYRWNGNRWRHYGPEDGLDGLKIHKIKRDRQGRLWFLGIGNGAGLREKAPGAYLYTGGRFTRWGVDEGLPSGRVYDFDQGPDSALWFGTAFGLGRWKNGTWKYWCSDSEGMWNYRIFTVAVDRMNRAWVGHQADDGVQAIDPDGSIHSYSKSDGLPGDDVWDIRTDPRGRLWVSTSEGLSCYHDGVWSSFGRSSGLTYPRIWPVLPLDNEVYVGTAGNGVSILHLGELEHPNPRVDIAEPIMEEEHTLMQWQPLSWWGDIPTQEILTRYRLDDAPWSEWSAQHEASMQDIPPGSHSFRVQAKGLFGFYDPSGASIPLFVRRPFYWRPGFLVPLGALSLAVIILTINTRTRKRKHARVLRESEARLRLITEATSSAIFIFTGPAIQFANSSAEALVGYGKEELRRIDFVALIHPEYRDLLKEQARRLTTDDAPPFRAEVKLLNRRGEDRWADVTFGRIHYAGVPATLVTASDITERKKVDEKLIAYQDKLKSLASDLTLTGERERRRMATFLHDAICQSLIFCKMKLADLQESLAVPRVKSLTREIDQLVDEAIENTQTLTFELSPPILYELGFVQAVEWLVERLQTQHQLRMTFADDGTEKPLGEDIRIVLFQAVREALINVVKHARATEAAVSLRGTDDILTVSIDDNGRGFDISRQNNRAAGSHGFGLFNMRERMRDMGGEVTIESRPGLGTRVVLRVPFAKSAPSNSAQEQP